MEDDFDTKIPLDKLDILLEVTNDFDIDPLSSVESEDFFSELLSKYKGDSSLLKDWLRFKIKDLFKFINYKPEWIQTPEWQFMNNTPMIFIGQINIPPGLFHDEASFYTFWDTQTGMVKTIYQVA